MKKIVLLLMATLVMTSLQTTMKAQSISGGIKAGLSFSTMLGEREMDMAGEKLESSSLGVGFLIGGVLRYELAPRFTVGAELLYSQKGGRYTYDGNGYENIKVENQNTDLFFYSEGQKFISLNITNSYLDLPIMFHYEVIENRLKLGVGANVGIMVSSAAIGELTFEGEDLKTERYSIGLDYKYFRDEAGEIKSENYEDAIITIGSVESTFDDALPSAVGAYYNFTEKDGSYFNRLDVGLNADIILKLGSSLELGVRANYGFLDLTNKDYDVSQYRPQDAENGDTSPVFRDDKDRNLSLQFTLGFNFN